MILFNDIEVKILFDLEPYPQAPKFNDTVYRNDIMIRRGFEYLKSSYQVNDRLYQYRTVSSRMRIVFI